MSWNTSAIFIHSSLGHEPEQLLARLGAQNAEPAGRVSFDVATSGLGEGWAIGVVEGWTLLFDPNMFLALGWPEGDSASIWSPALEPRLREMSRESEVVSFLLGGASGTAGFAHFKDGELARCFLFQDGQLKDVGAPSPEEQQAFAEEDGDEEQAVLSLAAQLSVSWDKIAEAEFALFRFDES